MTEENLSKHDEAVLNFRRGKQLERMTNHTGWTEVLKPSLQSRRAAEIKVLITAKERDDIVRAQQAVREIDGLFTFIAAQIALGKQASEILDNEKVGESET